jgi:hypothetical protein
LAGICAADFTIDPASFSLVAVSLIHR